MKYERIIQYVLETPWAIRRSALGAILDVLAYRADGLAFTDEELEERLGASQNQAAKRQPRRAGTVAVLPLYGSIFPRANLFTEMSGGTSLQKFSAAFQDLDHDSKVSNIVLDIASPGGSVELVPETAEIIRNASTPVTAVANAEAASAAYWLGSQADELFVTPSGMVGSIGVWSAHEDWSRHERNAGVDTTLIKAGKYKIEANPWEPLSEDAREAIQKTVDQYYDMFVDDVAKGRSESTAKVRSGYGEGRMLTASDAVTEGMADRIASLDQVLSDLASGGGNTKALALGDSPAREELALIHNASDTVTTQPPDDEEEHTEDPGPDDEEPSDEHPDESSELVAADVSKPWVREQLRQQLGDKSPSLAGGEPEKGRDK